MKYILLMLASLLTFTAAAQFENLVPGLVMSAKDGDGCTVKFCDTCKTIPVRFIGIDAPEIRGYSLEAQPYGNMAGDTLRSWIKGRVLLFYTLSLKGTGQRDYYGRLIAEPYFPDTSSVCFALVKGGWAWAVSVSERRHKGFNRVLEKEMEEAKAAKRGLWRSYIKGDGGVARILKPGTWRKNKSVKNKKLWKTNIK